MAAGIIGSKTTPFLERINGMGFLKRLFARTPKPGRPQTLTDEEFEQQVLASDMPAIVDFWSPSCAPCQVMNGLFEEIGPDYVSKVNFFKINVTTNPETARMYQVKSVPTLVIFKNHRPIDKVVGLIPLNSLRSKLDQLISSSNHQKRPMTG